MAASKTHWQTCEAVGKILNVPKSKVNQHYNLLRDHIPAILQNDDNAIAKGKEIIGDQPRGLHEDIKLAFWFIDQVGGLKRAKKIFQVAVVSLETAELDDETE